MAKTATFKKRTATFTKREVTEPTATFTKRNSETSAAASRDTPVSVYDPSNAAKKPVEMTLGEYEDMQKAARQPAIDAFVKVPTTAKGKLDQRYATGVMQQQKAYAASYTDLPAFTLIGLYNKGIDITPEMSAYRTRLYGDSKAGVSSELQKIKDENSELYEIFLNEQFAEQNSEERKEPVESTAAVSKNKQPIAPSDFYANKELPKSTPVSDRETAPVAPSESYTNVKNKPEETTSTTEVDAGDAYKNHIGTALNDAQRYYDTNSYYYEGVSTFMGLSDEDKKIVTDYCDTYAAIAYNAMDDMLEPLKKYHFVGSESQKKDIKSEQKKYATLANRLIEAGYSEADLERMIKTVSAYYNSRYAEEVQKLVSATMNDSMFNKVAINLTNVPFSLNAGTLAAVDTLVAQPLGNLGKSEGYVAPIDYNSNAAQYRQATSAVQSGTREEIEEKYGEPVAFVYDVANSVGQSVLASFSGPVGAVALGAGTAYDSAKAAHDRGASDAQAWATGVLAGIAESFFENKSLGNLESLKTTIPVVWNDVFENSAKSIGINASEELFTDMANLAVDLFVNREKSDFYLSMQAYMRDGRSKSDALLLAIQDTAVQLGLTTLAGGLSGGVMSAPITVANYATNRASAKEYRDLFVGSDGKLNEATYNALMTKALSSKDEAVQKYAAVLADRRDSVTANDAGMLYAMLEASEQQADFDLENSPSTSVKFDSAENYTPEKRKTIKEYLGAVNQEFVGFVQRVKNGEKTRPWFSLGKVNERTSEDVQRLTGIDVSEYEHGITPDDVRHVEKRHGENGEADHSMRDNNDVARVQYVLENYDTVDLLDDTTTAIANSDGSPAQKIKFSKKINGTYYVVEAVPDSQKKKMRIISAYISAKEASPEHSTRVEPEDITSETQLPYNADTNSIPRSAGNSQGGAQRSFATENPAAMQNSVQGEKSGAVEHDPINDVRNSLSEDGRAAFDIAMEGATDPEATARQFKIKYLEGETGAEFTVDEDGELTPSMQEAAYKYGAEAARVQKELTSKSYNTKAGTVYIEEGAEVSSSLEEIADTAAKDLHVPVSIVKTLGGTRGFYRTSSGEVVVAADAVVKVKDKDGNEVILKGEEAARRIILGHELTHRLKHKGGKAYARFERFVRDHVPNFDNVVAKYMKTLELDKTAATEEVVCDYAMVNLFSNAKIAEEITVKHSKIAEIIRDFMEWVRVTFGKKSKLGEIELAAKLWNDAYSAAARNAKSGIQTKNTADSGVKYSSGLKSFTKNKYFDRKMDKWDALTDAYVNVGRIHEGNPLHLVGIKTGPVYYDVSKIKEEMASHSDHLTTVILKGIPDLLSDPLVIAEYKPGENKKTVNVYGHLYTESGSPVVVGVMVKKGRSEGITVTKITTSHAEGHSMDKINDASVLYLKNNKKEIDAWFQARGNDVPLGGTQLGVIRSIDFNYSISNPEEKVKKKSVSGTEDILFSEEAVLHRKKAAEHFGTTYKWAETGYILADGTRLDFSGKHDGAPGGYRTVDHRDIREALGLDYGGEEYSGGMIQFMNEGNIRVMPETPGIDINTLNEPTAEQYARIESFVNNSKRDGYFYIDFSNEKGDNVGSIEYEDNFSAVRVLNDIRHFFKTGEVREQSEIDRFRSRVGTEDILFESEAEKAQYVADSFNLSGAENYKAAGSMERMSSIANSIAKAHRVNKDGRTKLAKALEKGVQNMRKAAKSDDATLKQTAAEGFLEAAMVISPDADVQAQVEIANALAESVWAEMTTDRLPETIRSIRDDAIKAARAEVRAERLAALGEKYGIIKPGERPSRVVTLPKKTSEGKKVSQTVRTVMEAEATPDEMIPTIEQMVADGEFSYETITDKGAVAKAEDRITKNGFDATVREWFKAVGSGKVSKDNTALGWTIYNNAANSGDTELAVEVLCEMVKHQRNAAQALQATRILKKLSPSGQLYAAQKSVQGLQEELEERYGDKAPELKIDPKLAEEVLNADTEEKCEKALADLYKDIGRQIPSSVMDKWNAWRYLSMLGNARTHIRNIVGNAGFAPVVTAKNVVATGIESLVGFVSRGKVGRTKAFLTPTKSDRALLAAAWSDYDAVADAALGQSKYNDNQYANKYIEEGKRVFKFKPLEAARRGNSWLLDKEDSWFSKPQYANALAQYCKANGITSEQIQSGKDLDKARAYAIKEAQKATYRDTNAFSELFSKLGRIDERGEFKTAKRIWNRGVEGVLPFRKTPANILARGIEYSPLGLVSVIRDLSRIKSGETTAAEAIDKAAATLTGTGLMALGAFLVTQGVLRGFGGDDDKEKEFEELMGHQQYALEIGGTSVTLDWLAPEALPFFVGANIAEQCMQDGEMTLEGFISALGSISDPMLSMSCLQGLNDLIESVSFSDTSGIVTIAASAATSYLTQGIPTLFGQIERTSESERMMTYTSKGNKMLTPDMQYTVGKVSAKLPGDYSQIPYIDAWGRTESSGSVGERAFNNFANPAYTSNISESDMEKELLRLYKQTGESVLPSRADKSFQIDGEEVYLTAEQYQKYATSKGKRSHRILTALTHSDTYNSLDDFTKAEIVSKVYSYCNAIAKSGCGAKNNAGKGYALDGWVSKAYDACSKYGIDEATYIAAYIMAGNAGKYVNGGETIDNSPGLCIMQAVYSIPGLSQEQYDAMFVNFGVGSKVRGYDKKTVESKIAKFNKKYERIEG